MKESIYENLFENSGTLTVQNILMNFAAAAVLSILIYVSYRIAHSGVIYSRKFNVSLVMLTLVTTLVMSVIGNNIALSLGMVGALSIVRFRTVIKDPRDTAYIFWCIAVGICCGVSDYMIAGIGTFAVFLFLLIFGAVRDNDRIMVVIKAEPEALESIRTGILSFFNGTAVLKMENISNEHGSAETIFEISDKALKKCEAKNGSFMSAFSSLEGVKSVSLVRQDEEINL